MAFARSYYLGLAAAVAVLSAGCAKSSSTVLKTYPAWPEDHPVDVLSEFPTDRPYEEVALLDAKGGQHTFADRSTAGVVEQLKQEARKVGADAVVIRSSEGGNYNWGQGGWDRAKADAVGIWYLGDSD